MPQPHKAFTQSLVEVLTKGSMPDMVWEITITCGISVFSDISADGRELIHNVEQAVYFGKLDGKAISSFTAKVLRTAPRIRISAPPTSGWRRPSMR